MGGGLFQKSSLSANEVAKRMRIAAIARAYVVHLRASILLKKAFQEQEHNRTFVVNTMEVRECGHWKRERLIENTRRADYARQNVEHDRRCKVSPLSQWRISWDIVVMVLLVYVSLVTPFNLAFGASRSVIQKTLSDFSFADWVTLDRSVDLLFIFDIFVNFRTALLDHHTGRLLWSSGRIARNYLKGWFLLDFVSCLPIDLILMGLKPATVNSGSSAASDVSSLKALKIARLIRLFKLIRVLRVSKLGKVWAHILDYIEDRWGQSKILTFFKVGFLCCAISLIGHIMACLWFLCGSMEEDPKQVTTLSCHV